MHAPPATVSGSGDSFLVGVVAWGSSASSLALLLLPSLNLSGFGALGVGMAGTEGSDLLVVLFGCFSDAGDWMLVENLFLKKTWPVREDV